MAKKIKTKLKLQLEAGKATPAPPVGTALGPHGINIQDFVMKFNEATREKMGQVIPAEITIYEDRTFDFILKTPPAAFLIRQAAKADKGSGEQYKKKKVGKKSKEEVRKIAQIKMEDFNANDFDGVGKISPTFFLFGPPEPFS